MSHCSIVIFPQLNVQDGLKHLVATEEMHTDSSPSDEDSGVATVKNLDKSDKTRTLCSRYRCAHHSFGSDLSRDTVSLYSSPL